MKGNPQLIEALNRQLSDELTAINQYIVHAEMCANWGYEKLHDHFAKRAIDEMKHVGVIFVMVVLGVVLRFHQEMRADNAAEKL